MRRRAKIDRNHPEIVQALRQLGYKIESLAALGGGVPDLLVWKPSTGLLLIEVKTPKGKLTQEQERFREQGWPVFVVRGVDDLLAFGGQS